MLALQALVLFEYSILLISEWLDVRKRDKILKNYDDEKETFTATQKHIFNFIMLQFIFNVMVLSIPSRSFSVRAMIQATVDSTLMEDKAELMVLLSIFLIISDLINTMMVLFFIQNVFPLEEQIPWCQITPKSQVFQEFVIYMFSIAVALPQYETYTMYIYAIFTTLSMIAIVYTKTYYDPVILKMSNFNQSAIIVSMLVLSCGIQRPIKFRSFYIVMIVLLSFIVVCLVNLVETQRKLTTFLQTEKLTKSQTAYRWLWGVHLHYRFGSEAKPERLQQVMIGVQNQIKRHQAQCNDSNCLCIKPKIRKLLKIKNAEQCTEDANFMLKLYLIEIFLSKLFGKTDQELQSNSKNDIIGLYLIFEWQKYKKNYLCCIYNLLKYHDCSSCNILECQQFYFLRKYIYHKLSEKQQTDEGTVRFQKMIYFEQSFKGFTQSISSTINTVNEFWQQINKNQLDIEKSEQISEKIIVNYHKYSSIYKKINQECGEIMIVERLAWRLNQEIMSFEQEALQNIENLKTIINKQRLHRKNIDDDFFQFNFKNYFIIISANPNTFQTILGVSKQLVKFVGYTEEFLLSNKLPVILPKVIDQMHERIIKSYLRKKTTSLQKIILKQQWLQRNDGTVLPVSINIIPKYDINEGLRLVGIIHSLKKLQIFDREVNSESVFTILADVNQKIMHVSQNCVKLLKFSQNFHQLDLFAHHIFRNIPETLENLQEFITELDITQALLNMSDQETRFKGYKARVYYNEKNFGNDSILRQYYFVLLVQNLDLSLTDFTRSSHQDLDLINFDFLMSGGNMHNSQKAITGDMNPYENTENTSNNQFMDLSSMSSNSSGSSTYSTQDAQIGEIKQIFEFNQLPKSLKIYRVKLIIGFLVIFATAIALLVVNVFSKDQFEGDLDALFSEKRIRNNFSSSKLISVLIFTTANIPVSINKTKFGIAQIEDDITNYYIANMGDVLDILQAALTDFGQKQAKWDNTFVRMFNEEQLKLSYLTTQGNLMYKNMTFQKGMTLFQDDVSFFENGYSAQFVAKHNIFDTNSVEEIQAVMRKSDTTMQTILSLLYNIVFNGSDQLLQQMLEIDNKFIVQILSHGDEIINLLLIFTICCCGIILVLTTFYLPYYFGVEHIQKQMIEFVHKTSKESVNQIIKSCKEFLEYIEKNKFLTDENDQEERRNGENGIGSDNTSNNRNGNPYSMFEESKEGQSPIRSRGSIISKQTKQSQQNNGNPSTFQHLHEIYNTQAQQITTTQQNQTGISRTGNTFQTQDRLDSSEDYLKLNGLNIKKSNNLQVDNSHHNPDVQSPNKQRQKANFLRNIMIDEGAETLDLKKDLRKQNGLSKNAQKYKIEKNQDHKQASLNKKNLQESNSENGQEDSSDEESKVQNTKKSGKKKGGKNTDGHHNTTMKTQNTKMGDDKKLSTALDFKILQKQTQNRKFKIGAIFYVISSLIIAFYISMFFFSRQILTTYQQGFYQYDVFFVRNTCYTETYFLMMKSVLFNQSMEFGDSDFNGKILSQVFDECSNNEIKIRNIKKDSNGMFKSLLYELQQVDQGTYCKFLQKNGFNNDCETDADGLISVGLDQIMASSFNHINQQRITYNAVPQAKRTPDFLMKFFFDFTNFRNIGIYYRYVEWTFRYVQNAANLTFKDQINVNFRSVMAVYIVFIGLVFILFFVTIHKLVRYLKIRLLKIRLTFKLIPSSEIFKNKDQLEKLNTQIL
eukprot:403371316